MKDIRNRLGLVILIASLTLVLTSCSRTPAGTTGNSLGDLEPVESAVVTPESEEATASLQESPAPKEATPVEPLVIDGFVKVTDIDSSIVVDLRYATADNFTGQKVYPTDTCVLRLPTARKLARANAAVSKLGYRIKVWDAYRPVSVQEIFWSVYPDSRYVANPSTGGSIHNRGCAVDVTLVDLNGVELVMPSAFDDFSAQASPSNPSMSAEARANLDILRNAMIDAGFRNSTSEWWHYSDTDARDYPIAEIDLSLF